MLRPDSGPEPTYYPLSTKKFVVSDFPQTLYKIPQDVPIKKHAFVFLNKSPLESYRNFYIFGFFNLKSYPSQKIKFFTESLSLAELEAVF